MFAKLSFCRLDDAISDFFHSPESPLRARQSLVTQVTSQFGRIRRIAECEHVIGQEDRIPVGVWVALTSREPTTFYQCPALNRAFEIIQEHEAVIIESGDRLTALVQQDLFISAECQTFFGCVVFWGELLGSVAYRACAYRTYPSSMGVQ